MRSTTARPHLIWCPKRRRVLAGPDVRAHVTKSFPAVVEEGGCWVEGLAVEEDRVHIFLGCPPRYSIGRVLAILKSVSASRTSHQFFWLRRKFWSEDLPEDGYAVRTVGDRMTADLIGQYIRRHDDEQATSQPKLF